MNTRQQYILEELHRQREVSVHALATDLHVSALTIRRDLELLEHDGALTRTHGGAVLSKASVIEFAFLDRAQDRSVEKLAIAKDVAAVVQPGMTIVLDTGTTTLEVARAIAGIPRLRVLTSSLAIASALHAYDNIDLVLLGGSVRHHSPDLSGPLTEENLKQFQTELAILGADAVSHEGLYTSDMSIARISQAMMACAREQWLVVDSSKFTRRSFVKFADWSAITHLVTDAGVTASDREWLHACDCEQHFVSAKTQRTNTASV
ncbi:MAG TPA: DeoR/GlpR family DNA-binding transcription regulator [Armatimonadota bacterium]|jgi:DeoR family fructose operon transcriptional repressor